MDNTSCFHCGDDFGKNQIVFQEKSFCRNGCRTIFEIFSVNELTCYYDLQNSPRAIPKKVEAFNA